MLPERNDYGYVLRRRRYERFLTSNDDKRNFSLYTDSYINIATVGERVLLLFSLHTAVQFLCCNIFVKVSLFESSWALWV